MKKSQVIKNLEQYQLWRTGAEMPMPDPKVITLTIINALKYLKEPNLKQSDIKEIEKDMALKAIIFAQMEEQLTELKRWL